MNYSRLMAWLCFSVIGLIYMCFVKDSLGLVLTDGDKHIGFLLYFGFIFVMLSLSYEK